MRRNFDTKIDTMITLGKRVMPTIFSVLLLLALGSSTEKYGRNKTEESDSEMKSTIHWSYQSQDEWFKTFKSCGGRRQSPVPLPDYCSFESTTVLDTNLHLDYEKYDQKIDGENLTIKNNGHSVQVTLIGSDRLNPDSPRVTIKPEKNVYQFLQLHFHWDQVTKLFFRFFLPLFLFLFFHSLIFSLSFYIFFSFSTKDAGIF